MKRLREASALALLPLGGLAAAGALASTEEDPVPTVTVHETTTVADPRVPRLNRRIRRYHRYARKLEKRNVWLLRRNRGLRLRLYGRSRRSTTSTSTAGMAVAQASWYGPGFYGNHTACGLVLTTSSSWVAHKTLGCGTRLLMCASRCARTFVGDRGPYVAGREFDLAPGLKSAIGFGSTGPVRWRVL